MLIVEDRGALVREEELTTPDERRFRVLFYRSPKGYRIILNDRRGKVAFDSGWYDRDYEAEGRLAAWVEATTAHIECDDCNQFYPWLQGAPLTPFVCADCQRRRVTATILYDEVHHGIA